MPLRFIGRASARDDYDWANCAICNECGGLSVLPVTQEQLEQAHSRYLRLLVQEGIMTKQEVMDSTGVSL